MDIQRKSHIEWELSNVDISIVNSIRRIIINEVPTIAMDTFYMESNSSIINDDIIMRRLALIPLTSSILINKQESCCSDILLDIECHSDERYVITSKDLKSSNSNIVPVYNNIIIAKLGNNQKIKLKALAIKGTGKQHAKWSPVSTVFYTQMNTKSILLKIETIGQLNSTQILVLSLKRLIEKTTTIIENINESALTSTSYKVNIVLYDEDHTLANPITRLLEKNNNVIFVGYSTYNTNIHLHIETKTIYATKVFLRSLLDLNKIYHHLLTLIESIVD